MFDVWLGDVELTEVIIYASILIMIPLQLLLCFKVKKLWVRLIPTVTLITAIILFMCMSTIAGGWDNIGYVILAIFAGILLAACALAWLIWFVWYLISKKKIHKNNL